MSEQPTTRDQSKAEPGNDLEKLAAEAGEMGLVEEFWEFLKYNKKWWLMPILVVLLLLGLLLVISTTAAGPFIYTLF